MSPTMVSTAQIGAQLEAVLTSSAETSVVAIHAAAKGAWPDVIQRQGRSFRVRWCESGLALREALLEQEAAAGSGAGVVLMTPLTDAVLPDDIAARLARARVYQPKGWEILRQVFGAREADARLARYDWMPEVLLEQAEASPFVPVAGNFLDLETAWKEVLRRCLGLDAAQPDAATLIRWSARPDVPVLLGRLPPQARTDTLAWLASHAGSAGRFIVLCIEGGRAGDAGPLGLVCDVLFHEAGQGKAELAQAAVRLERYVSEQHVGVADGREWAAQVKRLLAHLKAEEARPLLERADALLRELRVADFASLSDWLPGGLEQRLAALGQAIDAYVGAPSEAALARVEDSADLVLHHHLSPHQPLRAERVRMARRLVRWLARPAKAVSGLDEHIVLHGEDGAFVDWARFKLLGGDELRELSGAYANLRAAVAQRRDTHNKAFAGALAAGLKEARSLGPRAVPVESVLTTLVAPLAASHPVLLLVVDGLSLSIFRELFENPDRYGWVEVAPESDGRPRLGLTAFPTVTEVSRASLLCGKVTVGTAPGEKSAFAAHAGLLGPSSANHPPRLFHKGDLSVDGNLSPTVGEALANPSQKVVGVVYNAVDDHLSGPDQLHQRWSLEDLRLLLPLLREARESRRVLIVTADHGHMLEEASALVPGGLSDRWRPGTQATDPREVALSGSRVLTPEGASQVVCLWSETGRYTGRKNGYHGGASPAEAVVPLSVFAPSGVNVAGWVQAIPPQPEWWDLPALAPKPVQPVAAPTRPTPKRAPAAPEGQGALFGAEELPVPAAPKAVEVDWIAAVLESALYASQRQLAARVALSDEQMRQLLSSLYERGGKLTRGALAQRMAMPEIRVSGVLSAARRMLNLDQAAVLTVDDASGTVELNHVLLLQQFRITSAGGKP